jgi:peptidylprolyl isomerase
VPGRRLRLAFVLSLFACTATAAPTASSDDPVIAERGADHITLGQARAMLAATDADTRARLQADPNALVELLRNVLLQRALIGQANAEHWDQKPEIAALLQRARDQVLVQTYLTAHATVPAGYPSEPDIQAAYDANKSKLMQPRGYHVTVLYLVTPPASQADIQKRLAAVRTQLQRSRQTFEAAARQNPALAVSDTGWVSETQLIPAVRATVAGMLEGATSDPVCDKSGCRLVHLVATRPAGPAPLADVHDGLVRALRQQKQTEAERAYESALLQKEPVAINEIELKKVGK